MDKNVLRSFCVLHYMMVNTTRCAAVSHPICRFIVTLMPLHRTLCCYIVFGDAISYRSCYCIVPYAAISYLVSVKLVSGFHLKLAQNGHDVIFRPFPEALEKQTTTQKEQQNYR